MTKASGIIKLSIYIATLYRNSLPSTPLACDKHDISLLAQLMSVVSTSRSVCMWEADIHVATGYGNVRLINTGGITCRVIIDDQLISIILDYA